MRFICLHGAGTNSRLFELQTVALRYELGGDHTFEFVEGVVRCPVFPGVENLASTQEEFFAYYEPDSGKSFRKAIVDLQNYVSAEGPFDGIIAFSQGTSLAAALLLELQNDAANREGSRPQPLSFAVFFSGRLPFIDAGIKDALSIFSKKDTLINIPTAHIWGARDDLEPGQPQALTELCKADDMVTFVHQGGHEIPGSGSHEALTESVHAIRRALDGINK